MSIDATAAETGLCAGDIVNFLRGKGPACIAWLGLAENQVKATEYPGIFLVFCGKLGCQDQCAMQAVDCQLRPDEYHELTRLPEPCEAITEPIIFA